MNYLLYISTAMLVGAGLYDLGLSWMLAAGVGVAILAVTGLCEDAIAAIGDRR